VYDEINEWKQRGDVFVWRYPPVRKKYAGWHLTAEDAACDALISLLTGMRQAASSTRRTIALSKPSPPVWDVPNFGKPRDEVLGSMIVRFQPEFGDLRLLEEDGRLVLSVGERRVGELLEGLRDIRRGEGDYCLHTDEKGASLPIWLWWMPWSGRRET
jgi:hypothetical protein